LRRQISSSLSPLGRLFFSRQPEKPCVAKEGDPPEIFYGVEIVRGRLAVPEESIPFFRRRLRTHPFYVVRSGRIFFSPGERVFP